MVFGCQGTQAPGAGIEQVQEGLWSCGVARNGPRDLRKECWWPKLMILGGFLSHGGFPKSYVSIQKWSNLGWFGAIPILRNLRMAISTGKMMINIVYKQRNQWAWGYIYIYIIYIHTLFFNIFRQNPNGWYDLVYSWKTQDGNGHTALWCELPCFRARGRWNSAEILFATHWRGCIVCVGSAGRWCQRRWHKNAEEYMSYRCQIKCQNIYIYNMYVCIHTYVHACIDR